MSTETTQTTQTETSADTSANTNTVTDSETSTLISKSDQKSESGSDKTLLSQELANEEKKESESLKEVVPETYADWTLPEGVQLNPELNNEFVSVAKELKLTQSQAQKLVDLQAKYSNSEMKEAVNTYKETVKSWEAESIKEFGSELKGKLQLARKALDRLGDPELIKVLNDTGLGNHKKFIDFFSKAGGLIAEDSFSEGTKRPAPKSLGELFYPDMKV